MTDSPMALAAVQVAGEPSPRVYRFSADLMGIVEYSWDSTSDTWRSRNLPLPVQATARGSMAATTYTDSAGAWVCVYYVDASYAVRALVFGPKMSTEAQITTGNPPVLDDSLLVATSSGSLQQVYYLTTSGPGAVSFQQAEFTLGLSAPTVTSIPWIPAHPYAFAAVVASLDTQFLFLVPDPDTPGPLSAAIRPAGGSFTGLTELQAKSDFDIAALVDPRTGAPRVYSADPRTSDSIVEVQSSRSGWQAPKVISPSNATGGNPAPQIRGTAIVALVGNDATSGGPANAAHVYYIGNPADNTGPTLYALINDTDNGNVPWPRYNVNQSAEPTPPAPQISTQPSGWVRSTRMAIMQTPSGGHRVYYIGTDDNVWEVAYVGDKPGFWQATQIS